ncbi:hypothetical protein ACWIUD_10875 [Helicobacter sp. 23-1044]
MTRTFNKIGKIVAVASGIVLMGAIFSGCGAYINVNEISTESCKGSGIITQQSRVKIENKRAYKEVGECKNGLKEGTWKAYDSNDKIMQETNYTGGILNGTTKINTDNRQILTFYDNGKIVSELYGGNFYQYEENGDFIFPYYKIKRYRKYDIAQFLSQERAVYNKKVRDINDKNAQIEQENYQIQRDTEQKIAEAKQKAIEIAKQRAQSKVKKPTMQEVAKSKGAMEAYREKLKAQEEKELQIELAKIQMPQTTTKQTLSISPYQAPKLDTIEEVLAYIKDKKYTFVEYLEDSSTKIESSQDSDSKNFRSVFKHRDSGGIRCEIQNDTFSGSGCWEAKSKFSFNIKKSIFKDKINAILPNK